MEIAWGQILAYLGMFVSVAFAGFGSVLGVSLAGQFVFVIVA